MYRQVFSSFNADSRYLPLPDAITHPSILRGYTQFILMYPFSCYQIHSMKCKRHNNRNSSLHTPFPSIQFITIMQVVHNHIQNYTHWNDLHFVSPHPSHPFIQHPLHSHHISHPHSLIQKCGISLNMTSSFRDSLLPPLMIRRNAQQDRYDLMEVGLFLFE